MAATLTTRITAQIIATLSNSLDLGSPSAQIALSVIDSLASGTSNVQADKIFADTRTLAASASETLDMGTTGGLSDYLGTAFEPVEVVAVFIAAADGNTNSVVVGAAAAEPFLAGMGGTAPTETIKPGGHIFWYAPSGWAVTNNSNDKLKVLNSSSGTGVDYSIVIVARSA